MKKKDIIVFKRKKRKISKIELKPNERNIYIIHFNEIKKIIEALHT